jgi:molybdate transport system ATP-binding protein
MIRIRNIHVVKSGNHLFHDFSWQISENENWVISGPNGSGKTILLEALAGILHFPSGEIHYDFIEGDTWEQRYAEKRRQITYVPTHALHNFLAGSHELFYQQRYYDIGDEDIPTVSRMLGESIERLNSLQLPESLSIAHLLNVEVTRLSNGQLKKLLLLKSFLKGMPKLLLLDYPFEGLDHDSRDHLCSLIDFISKRHGVQVILVDHHHHLPSCINRRLVLNGFKLARLENVEPTLMDDGHDPQKFSGSSLLYGEEVVRMEDSQLRYGERVLFQNFNWTVTKGQRWALVGRNGSGKTTLFSLIFADHPQAYAQKIFLFGKRRGSGESIWDIKKRINYLGPEQLSYFNPKGVAMRGIDYIKNNHTSLDVAVLETLIRHFHADKFLHKQIRFLSSGELQLLMIINCFLMDKELFLLDEPFQFLDLDQKERLRKYLLEHLNGGTTLILITHYNEDIKQWTDMKLEI